MPKRDAQKAATQEDVARVAERAKAWVVSEEGRRQIEESQRVAEEMVARLREARRIDPKILREPMMRSPRLCACGSNPSGGDR